ncbi:longitudinals lacking protein, isoforms H/M/V-like isoform X2 [Atheta coriaria]
MLPQQYCLRWRYHHSNLQTMFSTLLEREAFCDVTLACEGRTIKAHKIVLSACSTFFDNILTQYEEKDPILIMKDVKYVDIKALVEFMYKGEINVDHCHLATLLKTAEELKIKGLAEVSWKDEDENNPEITNTNGTGIHAALQNVSAVMESPGRTDTCKRKRGRPPIDDYDYMTAAATAAKVPNAGTTSDDYSNDAPSPENHSSFDDEAANCDDDAGDTLPAVVQQLKVKPDYKIKMEYQSHDDSDGGTTTVNDQNDASSQRNEAIPAKHYHNSTNSNSLLKVMSSTPSASTCNLSASASASLLTAALEKEWPDVVKMNDYLNTGRRQQFWEEPFTKRVMDAIKHKNLEMKIAAELLGVSYGTLYGRYRDAYGCLKHPYRIKDFWTEQGPTDVLHKLKRKEITLFRAAEQLNVTPQTLSNYLISMAVNESNTSGAQPPSTNDQYEDIEWDDDNEVITPDALYQQITSVVASTSNVLPNCPDITIIKKEKMDTSRINNNSDHSDATH